MLSFQATNTFNPNESLNEITISIKKKHLIFADFCIRSCGTTLLFYPQAKSQNALNFPLYMSHQTMLKRFNESNITTNP